MWNESFSGDNGGWGGDASFATQAPKDSGMKRVADRLPVPVSVSDLGQVSRSDEKFVLGDYSFSTVLVMGLVKGVDENDQNVIYDIVDPENEASDFKVIVYKGLGNSKKDLKQFVEGTRIMSLGKLRSFADFFAVIAYDVMEVSNDQQYHAYTLEAKIAKLYFSKNVPNKLVSGQFHDLDGTCVGLPGVPANAKQGGFKSDDQSHQTRGDRLYPTDSANDANKKVSIVVINGLQGQRADIIRLLENDQSSYGEHGYTVEEIRQRLKSSNVDSIRSDLEYLATEGHVYTTISDDHYALIT